MSAKQIAITGLVAVLFVSSAQPAGAAEPLADKVRGSIDKGANYLKKHQENRGGEWNWENTGVTLVFKGGSSCLAALALLNSGVPTNDPVIQRVLPYIRKLKADQTYILGLQAMVLAEVGEAKDLSIIQGNVDAEAEQYGLVACVGSTSLYSTVFSQSLLPSFLLTQMVERFVPFSVACVRKMRSPQMTGVELP